MLGEPLPTPENDKVELVEGGTFTFSFELAIAPEFEVKLSKKDIGFVKNVNKKSPLLEANE